MDILNQLGKNWPTLLIFIAGILGAWGSWVSSKRNNKQADTIEEMGKLNNQLSNEIKKLQEVSFEVTKSTGKIVEENKKISEDNLAISEKSKIALENVDKLTIKVNELLNKVHNEITGGNSVPVVTSYLDFKSNNTDRIKVEIAVPDEINEKRTLNLTIQNIGDFPLSGVQIFRKIGTYRTVLEDREIAVLNLQSREQKAIGEPMVVTLNDPGEYFIYTIKVRWKVEYSYQFVVRNIQRVDSEGEVPIDNYSILEERYNYKDAQYDNKTDLVRAIGVDLDSESMKAEKSKQ